MILESEALVEFVAAHVHVVGFEVHSFDSSGAANSDSKVHGRLADTLRAVWRYYIKLVDEAVLSVEFQRESKAEDHVADKLSRFFE
jgi:hypothetical protein